MKAVKSGVGGWLLLLAALLIVWQPLSLGLVASSALAALPLRGLPLALVLLLRVVVTAVGIAAGLALAGRRPGAVELTKVSLVLSSATDVFVYTTPYFPNNRFPGETPYYVAASLIYYGAWMAYLYRSKRVSTTFS